MIVNAMPTTIGALVKKYIDLRDHLKAVNDKRDIEDKPYLDAMQIIEGAVAIHLREQNEQSVKTEHGTAYQSTTLSCRVADKEALFDFIRESDNFQLLAANVAKDALKEYAAEHQGAYPPGVDVTYVTRVNFRRA